jgi:osmotically-inducible protein OsmY
MLPWYKFIALTLIFALGTCAAASRIQAQELKTEIVPGASVKQPTSAAPSDQPQEVTHSSVSLDKDSAASVGHHHYNSDAERAQDDLLITEVKSALAEDGISNGYPVEVDADHGTVTLSGVVASAADVKAAAEDAADVRGVVAVRNLLKPQ